MTNSEKREQIIHALKHFDRTAKTVVEMLEKYLSDQCDCSKDFMKINLRKNDCETGKFENWTYRFHGDSCKFIHTETGQLLDVKMVQKYLYLPNGNFYLYEYIRTTADFKELSLSIVSDKEFDKYLREMVNEKLLINLYEGTPFFQAVLPLSKNF